MWFFIWFDISFVWYKIGFSRNSLLYNSGVVRVDYIVVSPSAVVVVNGASCSQTYGQGRAGRWIVKRRGNSVVALSAGVRCGGRGRACDRYRRHGYHARQPSLATSQWRAGAASWLPLSIQQPLLACLLARRLLLHRAEIASRPTPPPPPLYVSRRLCRFANKN